MTDANALYYMRARYYNVTIRRFINQDILTGEIKNSQSLNRYAYCQGNPVNYTDPFGLSPQITVSSFFHAVLNVAGLIPGAGEVFDFVNAIWYAVEGNYTEAGICMIGALPFLGTMAGAYNLTKVSKGLKFAANAGKMYIGGKGAVGNLNNIYTMYKNGTGQWYDYMGEGVMFALNAATCAGGFTNIANDLSRIKTENLAREIASQTIVRELDGGNLKISGENNWNKTFYTVQNSTDAKRLLSDGTPWPTEPNRANLGEGVYAWSSKEDALNYFNIKSKRTSDLQILEFEVSQADLSKMKQLDLTKMTDDEVNAFLDSYARLNGGTPNHGYEYIQRMTGLGVENYFNKSVFEKLKFKY